MYLATLVWPTSIPSLSNSRECAALHNGLAMLISRINLGSPLVGQGDLASLRLPAPVRRKPARCQPSLTARSFGYGRSILVASAFPSASFGFDTAVPAVVGAETADRIGCTKSNTTACLMARRELDRAASPARLGLSDRYPGITRAMLCCYPEQG
jgi:hypothetical protein